VKSSPHRVVLTLCGTALVLCGTVAWILLRKKWTEIDPSDPGRLLAEEMAAAVVVRTRRFTAVGSAARGWARKNGREGSATAETKGNASGVTQTSS
jgi:hypothetical protein